ncbi:MAG: hypothetical protein AAFY60_12275 [Myxococcota bacterium]
MKRWLLLWLGLTACDAPFVERGTRILIEPGGGFWEQPLPFDLRVDGLDPDAPEAVGELFDAAVATLDGSWSGAAIVVPHTGVLGTETFPEDTLDRDATVYLMTLNDSPARVAVTLEVEPEDGERPRSLVARLAGATPEPNTRYALIVTDFVRNENNSRIGRAEAFNAAWEGIEDADPDLRELALEVRAALVRDGVDLAPIVGTVVFETGAEVRP